MLEIQFPLIAGPAQFQIVDVEIGSTEHIKQKPLQLPVSVFCEEFFGIVRQRLFWCQLVGKAKRKEVIDAVQQTQFHVRLTESGHHGTVVDGVSLDDGLAFLRQLCLCAKSHFRSIGVTVVGSPVKRSGAVGQIDIQLLLIYSGAIKLHREDISLSIKVESHGHHAMSAARVIIQKEWHPPHLLILVRGGIDHQASEIRQRL